MKTFYIAVLALFLTTACDRFTNSDARQEAVQDRIQVHINDAEWDMPEEDDDSTITDIIDSAASAAFLTNEAAFNGIFVLSAQQYATVTLSIDGIVKTHKALLPGEYVEKDELLATLENPELIDLQQNYLDAHAQSEYLRAEYERQDALSQENAVSQKRREESRAEYLSMNIRKEAAAAQLSILGFSPQSIISNGMAPPLVEARAPISGHISEIQINQGKHVAAGDPLFEIIDRSSLLAKLTVYEKDLSGIKAGDRIDFSVNGMGNERFRGEVIAIGPRVDTVNRSLEVFAKVIDIHPLFRPGMYLNARVVRRN